MCRTRSWVQILSSHNVSVIMTLEILQRSTLFIMQHHFDGLPYKWKHHEPWTTFYSYQLLEVVCFQDRILHSQCPHYHLVLFASGSPKDVEWRVTHRPNVDMCVSHVHGQAPGLYPLVVMEDKMGFLRLWVDRMGPPRSLTGRKNRVTCACKESTV